MAVAAFQWFDHEVFEVDQMGEDVKSEGEHHSGDTDGASTEEDLAHRNLDAVITRRQENAQPSQRQSGERQDALQRGPAIRNKKHEAGHLGLMVGNWGDRAEKQEGYSKANSDAHDRQSMGCPAHIFVLCEASNSVAHMLGRPPKHDSERPQSRPQERAPTGNVSL